VNTRDPAKNHLLTPMNSALIIIDYQPVQTVHPSLHFIAQTHTREVMNICSSQDEISVKLLAADATDEILVGAAKSGDCPAVCGAVGATFEHRI
jgi:hypothetical protein